jgi:hypothetical protein
MQRRALALPALLVVAAIVVGACGGTAAPALSDPAEILAKAVESMQKAKSFHLEATVEGTFSADLTGSGQPSEISLGGTTLSADIDIANSNAHLEMAVPALLGMTADVIVVGEDTWTRTSFTGDKYQKSNSADSGIPVDATDPEKALKDLQEWLKKPEVAPTKGADASCGSKTCYEVTIDLTSEELKALVPDAGDLGAGSVVLTVLVEKDTFRPASLALAFSAADVGELTVTLTLSKWDEAVTIAAPPADQVQ